MTGARRRVGLALTGVVLVLFSCGPEKLSSPSPPATLLIGSVRDPVDAVVPGVVIRLAPQAFDRSTGSIADTTDAAIDTTDAAGGFRFPDVPPGLWVLESRPEHYLGGRLEFLVPDDPPPRTSVVLRLVASGALRGRVHLASGDSHEGTRVLTAGPDSISTLTVRDGSFLLDRVPLGPTVVRYEHPGWVPKATSASLVLKGDTLELEPVVLPASSTNGHLVSGSVDDGSRPLAGATLTLEGPLALAPGRAAARLRRIQTLLRLPAVRTAPGPVSRNVRQAISDAAGAFFFDGVAPGRYELRGTLFGYREGRQDVTIPAIEERTTIRPTLSLVAVGAITGRAELGGGGVPEGIEVLLKETKRAVVTDTSGTFRFGDLPLGEWTVEYEKQGYVPQAQTATLLAAGEVDTLAPVRLRPGRIVTCLEFVGAVADTLVPPSVISAPRSVDVGPDGTIFVLDTFWGRVQKFHPDGQFLGHWDVAVAPVGEVRRDLAVEPGGTILVSSGGYVDRWSDSGIRQARFTSVGTPADPRGRYNYPFTPLCLAVDESGHFYCTEFNGKVHKFTPAGRPYRYPQFYPLFDSPRTVATSMDRVYLEAADRHSTLVRDSTLTAVGTIPGDVQGLDDDGAGGIFIIGPEGLIRHVDRAGNLVAQFGRAGSRPGEFRSATSLALAPNGLLYVADFGNARVQLLRPDGAFVAEWPGFAPGDNIRQPQHCAVASDGQVYVANEGTASISRFDPDGRFASSVQLGIDNLPRGMSFGPDGTLWVMALIGFADGHLLRFDRDLLRLSEVTPHFGDRDQSGPGSYGVFADAAGQVYACDEEGARVMKFNGDGTLITQWGRRGSGPGEFEQLRCVTTTPDDSLILTTDYKLDRVQVFTAAGEFVRAWGEGGTDAGQFQRPTGITVDREGRVYVSDTGNRRLQIFTILGRYLGEFTGAGGADQPLVSPVGLAMDRDRRYLHVTDLGSDTIRIYDVSSPGCMPAEP